MIAEDRLARAYLESRPSHAAMTLERMPVTRAAGVLRAVPARVAAIVLRGMTVASASDCLGALSGAEAAAIATELPTDSAAGIVRAMEPAKREPLLAALSPDVRDSVTRVLPYPDGTAGAVMDPFIFHLPVDVVVADARVRLRRAARELLYYLYIVDRDRRLVGVLDIPELLLARPRDPVSVAMHRGVERLNVWMPVALVREHGGWHRYHAMPVVDEEDRLLGAIRYQTLRRLERESPRSASEPARVTAGALAELFHLGTTGLITGIATTTSARGSHDRSVGAGGEVPHDD